MKRLMGLMATACFAVLTLGAQGTPVNGYGDGGYSGMMGGPHGGSYGYGGCGYGPIGSENARPEMSVDDAKAQADKYLSSWGDANLAISEIMEFDNQFYIAFVEKDSGVGAFEMLMDKYTGTMTPEPGPNMMWNLKYGMMSERTAASDAPKVSMPVSLAQADADAQKYLDSYNQGFKAETGGDPFHGYYTLHVLEDGKIIGMLGVNGYTGQVWYHSWHGNYIGMKSYS